MNAQIKEETKILLQKVQDCLKNDTGDNRRQFEDLTLFVNQMEEKKSVNIIIDCLSKLNFSKFLNSNQEASSFNNQNVVFNFGNVIGRNDFNPSNDDKSLKCENEQLKKDMAAIKKIVENLEKENRTLKEGNLLSFNRLSEIRNINKGLENKVKDLDREKIVMKENEKKLINQCNDLKTQLKKSQHENERKSNEMCSISKDKEFHLLESNLIKVEYGELLNEHYNGLKEMLQVKDLLYSRTNFMLELIRNVEVCNNEISELKERDMNDKNYIKHLKKVIEELKEPTVGLEDTIETNLNL